MADTRTSPTLAAIVNANPSSARTLERFGLDYCCHGGRTIEEACTEAGLDVVAVTAELGAVPAEADRTWVDLAPSALADHVVEVHHRYLWEELPLLEALAERVLAVHGGRHAELVDMNQLVIALRADLEPHLLSEERVLFPAIHALAAGRRDFPFGSVTNSVRMMTVEHDRAGELLAELRAVSYGYEVPADACASYRSLYERLEALEADTHMHIHKENHVLFPAAIELAVS